MTTREEAERKLKERKEAEKRNPLLRMGLGDLEKECHELIFILKGYTLCNDILSVPSRFKPEYMRYQSLIDEINRRYPRPELDYDKIERALL